MKKIDENLHDVINKALALAKDLGHSVITTEHVFLSLLDNEDGGNFIRGLGGNTDELHSKVLNYLHTFIDKTNQNVKPIYTIPLENVFTNMMSISDSARKDFVDIYDLLAAITYDSDSYSTRLLESQNIQRVDILEHLSDLNHPSDDSNTKSANPLSLYTIELVELARSGSIDPVIGRDLEIDRVCEVL